MLESILPRSLPDFHLSRLKNWLNILVCIDEYTNIRRASAGRLRRHPSKYLYTQVRMVLSSATMLCKLGRYKRTSNALTINSSKVLILLSPNIYHDNNHCFSHQIREFGIYRKAQADFTLNTHKKKVFLTRS